MRKQYSIKIRNEFPDTHYFLYKNKKYPIKFDYFKLASEYFIKHESELASTSVIKIDESEDTCELKESTLDSFIKFVQHQEISINEENVLELHYLSKRFEVDQLFKETSEFIKNNIDHLSISIILANQREFNQDNEIYEEIISDKMEEFIDDEKLQEINIPTLYRIISKYFEKKENKLEESIQNKINEFLMKILEKNGREASVLFTFADFNRTNKNILTQILNEYSNIIDFNYIKKSIVDIYLQSESEIIRKEKEYQTKIEEIKRNSAERFEEFRKEKEIQIENLNQQIQKMKEKKDEMKNEILQIKKNDEEKLKIIKQIEMEKSNLILTNREHEKSITKLTEENKELSRQLSNLKKESENQILSFSPKEGKEFSGIVDYLTNKTGSNIHDNGTIEVTSNSIDSDYSHPKYLLDQNNSICYGAKPKERGATVVFDFKDMEIEITKYTIKTGDWGKDHGHIKNWVIEISNDLNKWTTIDEHSNSSELNGSNYIKTFNTTNQRFSRYCRFRHTGDYYGMNYLCYMGFQSIEFYGRLKTTLKK